MRIGVFIFAIASFYCIGFVVASQQRKDFIEALGSVEKRIQDVVPEIAIPNCQMQAHTKAGS